MKKKLFIIATTITTCFFTALYLSLNFDEYQILPFTKNSDFTFLTYAENIPQDATSKTAKIIDNGELEFSYSLTDAVIEPFAAVSIYKKDKKHIDLSRFNQLTISLAALKAKRIPVTITFDLPGFTSKEKPLTNVPITKVIDYHGKGAYTLNLDDMEIPSWWFREKNKKKEDFKNLDFSRANYVVVGSCQVLAPNVKDKIVISKIDFSFSNTGKYAFFSLALFTSYLGLFIYFLLKRKKVIVPVLKTTTTEDLEPKTSKIDLIIDYIGNHYNNPELSVNDLQQELGISAREIGTMIKKELNASFKSYLNTIRLTEVKRLLTHSDAPISEIAYRTGYNNVSHFNRVFKTEFGITPKSYREDHLNKG